MMDALRGTRKAKPPARQKKDMKTTGRGMAGQLYAGGALERPGAGPAPWKTSVQVWKQVPREGVRGVLFGRLDDLKVSLLPFLVKRDHVIPGGALPTIGGIKPEGNHAAHFGAAFNNALIDEARDGPAEIGLWKPDLFGHPCLRHHDEIFIFHMAQEDEQDAPCFIAQISPG